MRYSFEFKMKCVELYRQGIWAETPEKVMKRSFQRKILNWDKIERIHGPKGLERVKKQRNWTVEEKLTFVLQVLNGKALTEVAFSSGISEGLLGSWVHKYKTYGYNGLKNKKRGRPLSKEPIMNKKTVRRYYFTLYSYIFKRNSNSRISINYRMLPYQYYF